MLCCSMLVLFDLDGTVIDSLDAWAAAYRQAVHPRQLTDEQIVSDFFHTTPEVLSRHGVTDLAAYYSFLGDFLKNNPHLITVAADAEYAMGELKRNGHLLGVITARNKEFARMHCPQEILSMLDVFIDRHDAPPKPLPDGVLKACKQTGVSLRNTVLVGDHPIDAKCAQNAGVRFLFYKPGDHVFRNHAELNGTQSFSRFKQLPQIIGLLQT